MWTCSKCTEVIQDSFEVCWACGTSIDGVEDPHFFAEDHDENAAELHALAGGNPENLITVARCMSPTEAYSTKMRLEQQGVPVFLADEFTVSMDWLLSNAVGGIKVQVPKDDLPRAAKILGLEYEEPPPPSDEEDPWAEDEPDVDTRYTR